MPEILRRLPRVTPILLALTLACDSTGPTHGHGLFASLQATALFRDSTSGLISACHLSGAWEFPGWPTTAREDTTSFYLARELANDTLVTIFRDTLVNAVRVTLTRVDSVSLTLELGPPFNAISAVTLDSATGTTLTGSWPCPPSFPLSGDTALLNHGYQVDSIRPGSLVVNQQVPVD